MNPLYLILVVNLIGLVWAIRSWKKNMQERWMNNLRDAGSELIGAAEHVYGLDKAESGEAAAAAKSQFIAKEQKLLLLFSEGSETQKEFRDAAEKLRNAADAKQSEPYRGALKEFSSLVNKRIMKEWKQVSVVLMSPNKCIQPTYLPSLRCGKSAADAGR